MARLVKPRRYRSPLRVDQARETRVAIIAAAGRMFGAHGYAAVSFDAIAKAAGVSRATVFASVGGKPALLKEAFRAAFGRAAGAADVEMPLVERPRSREVRASRTVTEYLAGYAAIATAISSHVALVHEAMREAARADPEVRAVWDATNAERRRGADTIVADVKARAPLRAGLDDAAAADIVWVLNDPGVFHMLVHLRGWPEPRFEAWLARALASELLG